jgi:hypothetical protein
MDIVSEHVLEVAPRAELIAQKMLRHTDQSVADQPIVRVGSVRSQSMNLTPAVGPNSLALGGYQFDFCVQGQAACKRRGGSSWRPLRYLTRA